MDRDPTPQKARRGGGGSNRSKPKGANRGSNNHTTNNAPSTSRQPTAAVPTPTILRPQVSTTIFTPDQPRQQMHPSGHQKLYEPSSYPSSPPPSLIHAVPRNALHAAAVSSSTLSLSRLKASPSHDGHHHPGHATTPTARTSVHAPSLVHTMSGDKFVASLRGWKLVNAQLQFCAEPPAQWADMTQYQVIGCIGLEGVGKSSILSMLCGHNLTKSSTDPPLFPIQSTEAVLGGKHQTSGLDMCITPDNVVWLDCQPFLSTSILLEMTQKNESPKFGSLALDHQIEVQSLSLLVYLLSVCHYVVVAYDALEVQSGECRSSLWLCFLHPNTDLWQLVQTAQLLKCRLPSISGELVSDHTAKLIFVGNKMQDTSHEAWRRHDTILRRSFTDYALFLLPTFDKSNSAKHGQDEAALRALRAHVLRLPWTPLAHKSALAFKEWVANGARIYDSIRKAQPMVDYSRLLQKSASGK
ncbi:Aste57867_13072 [Aphanomyces stellatus]|uniref:Aste57867_13072 protein n=1 Tax=Aphanomyces stellatus TaxID=120398 RepID=A0A485KZA5_9STRA|nr:hypothetical protein As57867_013024 [Aphanomyces stellatus]VFT89916.1 Aste57867_13072 [Aphanomyces stellatus]